MASADILRAARARIEDPKNWTSKAYARDAHGRVVEPTDETACKFCALGALVSVGVDEFNSSEEEALLRTNTYRMFGRGIVSSNDLRGHSAILEAFDAAIAAAEAEAGR